MQDSSCTDFIQLTQDELKSVFSRLQAANGPISVWKHQQKTLQGQISEVTFTEEFHLVLSSPTEISTIGEEYVLSVLAKNVSYFMVGKLEESSAEKNLYKIVSAVYKCDNRQNERVLAFPHRKAYVYFQLKKKVSKNNVTPISRSKRERFAIFKDFIERQNEANPELKDKMGFRVIDISPLGISFFTNEKESESFEEGTKLEDFLVDLDGEFFQIAGGETIYKVSYLDSRVSNVPMFKIGISFSSSNEKLDQVIEEIVDFSEIVAQEESEFESFIKEHKGRQ